MFTVLDVLRVAAEYLERQGVESPRLNAELMLAHVLGVKRIELYLAFDQALGEEQRAPMRVLVRARGEGKPLQHLLGSVEFLGREFASDARALVPRPETELLLELLLRRLPEAPCRVLDVGTGSGVLAVSMALERPAWKVAATDLSAGALALAAENAARHRAPIAFEQADLLPAAGGPFDLIVANLPYVPADDLANLSREVRHDPIEALDGGPDGLRLIARLAALAPARLEAGGLLALEIGFEQSHAVRGLLDEQNYRDIAIERDYQGHERFVFAVHG